MAGLFESLEQECTDRLEANPFFVQHGIEVHNDPQKNIVAEVERKIAQLRFLVSPLVQDGDIKEPDEPPPKYDPLRIVVGVFENPTLRLPAGWDGTTGRRIVQEVMSISGGLHLFQTMSAQGPIYGKGWEVVPNKTLNIWNCKFEVAAADTGQVLLQVATPTGGVVVNGGNSQVTLACATGGAGMFYTTDGTKPNPRNGTLYLAPFQVANGTKVRARAWLAGYFASEGLTVQT